MKNFYDKTFLKHFLKMAHWGKNICIIWDSSSCKSFTLPVRKTSTPREKWAQDKQFTINDMQMVNKQKKNYSASFIIK